jgi:hypothetical protein
VIISPELRKRISADVDRFPPLEDDQKAAVASIAPGKGAEQAA